jgi:hypothetical protein
MNLTEKVSMMHGIRGQYTGTIQGNERLGIPPILMQDGPQVSYPGPYLRLSYLLLTAS